MSEWHDVVSPGSAPHVAKHLRAQCQPAWCGHEPDLAAGAQATLAARYENALKWISTVAKMHYIGAAFDPEHMRAIANMAVDALEGKELPDWATSVADARERADDLYAKIFADLDDEEISGEI